MIVFLQYVTESNMLRTFKNTVSNNQVIQFVITYARKEELFLEMQKKAHHFIQTAPVLVQ